MSLSFSKGLAYTINFTHALLLHYAWLFVLENEVFGDPQFACRSELLSEVYQLLNLLYILEMDLIRTSKMKSTFAPCPPLFSKCRES